MNKKMLQSAVPYLGLVIVIVLFTILTQGKSMDGSNWKLIIEQALTLLICSAGVMFVMTMGSLDFSQGSIVGLACYAAAVVSSFSIPLAIVAAVGVGAGIGLLNGVMHAKFKIQSFIVTMCTMFIFRGLVVFFTSNFPAETPYAIYDYDNLVGKFIVVVAIVAAGFIVFRFTKLGRQVRAIGSGEIAAAYSGVNVDRTKILAFVIAGALAGIAAFFALVRTGSATAQTGNLMETNVMIALVLGGLSVSGGARSNYMAVIIGAMMLTCLTNGLVLIGADPITQQLIKGIIFLLCIIITTDRKRGLISK